MKSTTRRDALKTAGAILAAGFAPGTQATGSQLPQPSLQLPRAVRVGLIGLEGHYSEILSVVSASPQVRLAAIAEADPGLRSKAADDALL